MPSLRCWDSECRLSVSVQSQNSSWSPEMYLGHSKETFWMSYLQPMSVRNPHSLLDWEHTPCWSGPPATTTQATFSKQSVEHERTPLADVQTRGSDQTNRRRPASVRACDPVNVAFSQNVAFQSLRTADFYKKLHPTSYSGKTQRCSMLKQLRWGQWEM